MAWFVPFEQAVMRLEVPGLNLLGELWHRIPGASVLSSSWLWLPEGSSWEQLEQLRAEGMLLPHVSDLKIVCAYAIAFAVVRQLLERTIFKWIGDNVLPGRPAAVRT
jgi:hypothetical protein